VATIGAMLVPAAVMASPAAVQARYQDAVTDSNGKTVTDFRGNCVVTKWEGSNGKCASKPAAAADVHSLSKEQLTVYFDFNKSTLNATEKAKLDGLAKIIASSKEVSSVDMVGFADKIGKAGYNKALSTKRANTVKSYLAAKGLKTRKVKVEGLGASKSVTNCDDKEAKAALVSCLAEDRRVEIVLNFVK
jgi:outer membrane protein OmpA-like peptidoglycan-associated protein